MNRRHFLRTGGAAALVPWLGIGGPSVLSVRRSSGKSGRLNPIYKAIKLGMFQEDIPIVEKFRRLKEMGFDGVELSSPGGADKEEAREASRNVGLPIHGVVNSVHWNKRLSDPDPKVRAESLKALKTALKECHLVGGSAVLLVPGKVTDPANENHFQVWRRSIEEIRKALPLAARLGVQILIENVWNRFCYEHNGPPDQTASLLAAYIDAINSPWVGAYFDIGNHRKYGNPADWIRTLGSRIVKLDVKDWGQDGGFGKIGAGDVDWPAVRHALKEIGYTGWATAEVSGGDRNRIREIGRRMDQYLLGA